MPMLDIPQVVNTVSDKALKTKNATTPDEALHNVSNVVQTNTPGGTQEFRAPWLRRKPRWLDHDQRLRTAAAQRQCRNRARGGAKGPASTLYGILDPGGLINVVTKRLEKILRRPDCHQPALAAVADSLTSPVQLKVRVWPIARRGVSGRGDAA